MHQLLIAEENERFSIELTKWEEMQRNAQENIEQFISRFPDKFNEVISSLNEKEFVDGTCESLGAFLLHYRKEELANFAIANDLILDLFEIPMKELQETPAFKKLKETVVQVPWSLNASQNDEYYRYQLSFQRFQKAVVYFICGREYERK